MARRRVARASHAACAVVDARETTNRPPPMAPGVPATPVPDAIRAAFPQAVHDIVALGHARVVAFQDRAYGQLYLERVTRVLAAERAADPAGAHSHALTRETARYLALWMAFDDIVRVADLKCRAEPLRARASRGRGRLGRRRADLRFLQARAARIRGPPARSDGGAASPLGIGADRRAASRRSGGRSRSPPTASPDSSPCVRLHRYAGCAGAVRASRRSSAASSTGSGRSSQPPLSTGRSPTRSRSRRESSRGTGRHSSAARRTCGTSSRISPWRERKTRRDARSDPRGARSGPCRRGRQGARRRARRARRAAASAKAAADPLGAIRAPLRVAASKETAT